MDDQHFDGLVRAIGSGVSRRHALKVLFGGAGVAVVGGYVRVEEAEAARRGFSGPTWPKPTPTPCVDGSAECVVPQGGTSILLCDQGTWQQYDCINGQECISYSGGNDFCEITV